MAAPTLTLSSVTEVLPEPVTCPRRMLEFGPWERKDGLDHWLRHGNGDRVCSFCGSLHPDDFWNLVGMAADAAADVELEPSTKPYKFYVHRPDVPNAMCGGIKFYTQHLPGEPTYDQNEMYKMALRRHNHRMAELLHGPSA